MPDETVPRDAKASVQMTPEDGKRCHVGSIKYHVLDDYICHRCILSLLERRLLGQVLVMISTPAYRAAVHVEHCGSNTIIG